MGFVRRRIAGSISAQEVAAPKCPDATGCVEGIAVKMRLRFGTQKMVGAHGHVRAVAREQSIVVE